MGESQQLYTELFEDDEYEDVVSTADIPRVQRGVSNVSSLRRTSSATGAGTGTLSVKEAEFADPRNLETSVMYLRSGLQASGLPPEFKPEGASPEEAAKTCNLVYALLMQRQRDQAKVRELEEMQSRLSSSLSSSEVARGRLETRLQAQERELGNLENKMRSLGIMHKSDTARMHAEAGDLQKSNAALKRKQSQAQHELRRKDLEIERLQARVHGGLTARKRDSGDNLEAAERFTEIVQKAASSRREEDNNRKAMLEYEERMKEVVHENKALRSAFDNLQSEQRAILGNQLYRESQLNDMKRMKDKSLATELADLSPVGVVKKLLSKLEQLDRMSASLCCSIPASPVKDGGVQIDTVKRLKNFVETSRSLLSDYMALAGTAMHKLEASLVHSRSNAGEAEDRLLRSSCSSREAGLHVSVAHLEEEYRAKVLELESKLATAQFHAQGQSGGSLKEAAADVEAARQALTKERIRIAQALDDQTRELSQAKLEFETTKSAFDETLRQFAPGFGAGGFLARAMAKNATKTANDRFGAEQATHAGNEAVKMMGISALIAS